MSASVNIVETDDGQMGTIDPQTGALHIETGDGGLLIRRDWRRKQGRPSKHDDNLADVLGQSAVEMVADDLLRGIEADERSRAEYLDSIGSAIRMLGLEVNPRQGSDEAAPLEGMSTFRHPLLLKAVLRFQADFVAELLPADGPVKVRDDDTPPPPGMGHNGGPGMDSRDDLAGDLEKDLNHYLTTIATEYYPDTTRMAFRLGLVGGAFKKVYGCPLRRRPVSESVDAEDIIVDYSATDLRNAARITHRIMLRHAEVRRLVKAGVYRDVPLGQPRERPDAAQQAEAQAAGRTDTAELPADHRHTVYECYTELDLPGFEADDGLYRPYRVTIDRDSRMVLEVRRNWAEDDPLFLPRRLFVQYPYVQGIGFYGIGLMHLLGSITRGLTAAYRLIIDAGMFANFPGFLTSEDAGRQTSNMVRVPPGGSATVQTGGKDIHSVVMPLPYRTPDASFMSFVQHLESIGDTLSGSAELPASEGRANMPVGTMLAMIEQAVKPIAGVFKGLHRAQAEEFALLKERFREDPAALWRFNPRPARPWQEDEFLAALEDADLVPMADPNTASQVQRIAKAMAVLELAKQAPYLFQQRDTALRFLRMIGLTDAEDILNTPEMVAQAQAQMQPPGKTPNPALDKAKADQAEAQANLANTQAAAVAKEMQLSGSPADPAAADRQARAAELLVESKDRAADREARLQEAGMRQQETAVKTAADMAKLRAQSDGAAQDRTHEVQIAGLGHQADASQAASDRLHEAGLERMRADQSAAEAAAQRQHEAGLSNQEQTS